MKFVQVRKTTKRSYAIAFLEVTKDDAIEIINSLSAQIVNKSGNSGRKEWMLNNRKLYFSIGVIPENDAAKSDSANG